MVDSSQVLRANEKRRLKTRYYNDSVGVLRKEKRRNVGEYGNEQGLAKNKNTKKACLV